MKSFSGAILGAVVAVLVATYGVDAQQGGGGGQAAQGQGGGEGRGQGRGGGRGGGTQDVLGGVGTGRANAGPAKPAPRNAAGRALLGGADMKDKGVWLPVFGILDPIVPYKTVPFQPWAKAVYDMRQTNELEPHTRCKPSGSAREFLTPYGVEFVELPEAQRIFIFDIGGPHTFRTIYMDGRSHPKNFTPTYYGHSIGWWEGDTLVVDTTGYNERFWLDRRGLPHTDRMHTIEKFTRTNQATIAYEITVDDPGAYTAPMTGKFNLRWEAGTELFEYMCQQANYATELMVGSGETGAGKTTDVVP
jgi:hypothetical protein